MERTVLITGRQSTLRDDLLQEALARSFKVFATYDPSLGEPEIPDGFGDELTYVEWNRRSPISARSVLLALENGAEAVEEVFVVFQPETTAVPFNEAQASQIEEVVDGSIKGYLFLLREILAHGIRRAGVRVNLVVENSTGELTPPLEAATTGAFLAGARALMALYQQESIRFRGFQSSGKEGREYARFVLDTIRDKGEKSFGRWSKFGGRGNLFPFRK